MCSSDLRWSIAGRADSDAFQKERADCFPHRLEVERIDIPLEDVLRTGHLVTPLNKTDSNSFHIYLLSAGRVPDGASKLCKPAGCTEAKVMFQLFTQAVLLCVLICLQPLRVIQQFRWNIAVVG